MAVRLVENRWPRDKDDNPLSIDSLGYATGDINTYVLVSYLTERLYIGSENQYVVFVLNGLNITTYEWKVRRCYYEQVINDIEEIQQSTPGHFSNKDEIKENGLFSWIPIEEGRYKITVTFKDEQNNDLTLTLYHKVFDVLDSQDYINEARSTLITSGSADDPNMAFGAADLNVMNEIVHDLWEYLTLESIFDKDNIIPINVFVTILYNRMLQCNKSNRKSSLENTGNNWIALLANQDIRTGLGSKSLGLFNLSIVSASMVNGYISWQTKDDIPESNGQNTWMLKETIAHDNFNNLPEDANNIQFERDIYNLLRFPKSAIKIVGDLIRKLKLSTLPAKSINVEICKHFYRYTSFNENIDNNTFQTRANSLSTALPFLSSLFLISKKPDEIFANDLRYIQNPPTPADKEVIDLKKDLAELGFNMAIEGVPKNINTDQSLDNTATDGHYNLVTEWAVKEFQIYSKMKFIAKERENAINTTPYHEKLRRYPNLLRYTGAVSGVANKETRKLIKLWKALQWRCPVVISAFERTGIPPQTGQTDNRPFNTLLKENVWRHDSLRETLPRVSFFVQDYSGHWDKLPDNHLVPPNVQILNNPLPYPHHDLFYDGKMALGTFTKTKDGFQGTHNSKGAYCWGGAYSNQSINIFSTDNPTRRIIHAVVLRETGDNFEVINCWDGAFLSLGYFHWTIGTRKRNDTTTPLDETTLYSRGELQGFLTYFKLYFHESFKKCVVFFGLNTSHNRLSDTFETNQVKRSSDFRSQQDNFEWVDSNQVRDLRPNINNSIRQFYGNHNYHRTWHSFYRWVMALRKYRVDFRMAMWNFTRIRLRDLQNTLWTNDNNNVWGNITGNTGNLTFGQVFRSERTWALLLRWHVNAPADVVKESVSIRIKNIYHFVRCNRLQNVTYSGSQVTLDNLINSDLIYYRTPILNANNEVVGWNSSQQGQPPQNSDIRTIKGRIRENLFLMPVIQGDDFDNPQNWPIPSNYVATLPDQQIEEDFCRAIILYIRQYNNNSLKTSMGIIYHDFIDSNYSQQNFALDTNDLP